MGTFADPSIINWLHSETKRENNMAIRKRMAPSIIAKKQINCLTFPAESWIFEQDLCNSFRNRANFKFTGLEVNREVHQKVAETARKLAVPNGTFETTKHPRSLLQFLGTSETLWTRDQFDLVYADWMGTWNFDTKEAVRRMLVRKVIAPGGFLLITIMLGRGTIVTLKDLDQYMTEDHFYEVLDLDSDVDANTRQRMSSSEVGPLKVMGVTNLILSMAQQYGQIIKLLRLAIYDSQLAPNKNITTPEISLLYRVSYK